MPTTNSGSIIGSLLNELRNESSTLLWQEVALAKAELSEAAAQAGRNSLAVAIGGAIAYAGGLVLLIGIGALAGYGMAALGLSPEIAPWLGFVLVGAITALIGWSKFSKAKQALRPAHLVPHETIASLRENRHWAREKIHQTHEPAT